MREQCGTIKHVPNLDGTQHHQMYQIMTIHSPHIYQHHSIKENVRVDLETSCDNIFIIMNLRFNDFFPSHIDLMSHLQTLELIEQILFTGDWIWLRLKYS